MSRPQPEEAQMRRLAVAVALGAIALLMALVAGPASAQTGGSCNLQCSASFNPGLNSSNQPFSYSFAGQLSSCQSNQSGAPTSGSVEAGKVYTDSTGEQFQEPVSTGQGGCSNSTTSG